MADLVILKTERAGFNEEAIALLEQTLDEARQGLVAACGIAVVRPDGHVNCGFTNFDTAGLLLGASSLLQSRIIANMEPK